MDTSTGGPRFISSDDTVMINTMVNGQKKYDVVTRTYPWSSVDTYIP